MSTVRPVGDLLREWRQRRRLSQLDLACEAEISTRHLSFVETGRSQPSRKMILHLCEQLDMPIRERNVLLVAAGYAPIFPERSLGDPALQSARKAIDVVLESQKVVSGVRDRPALNGAGRLQPRGDGNGFPRGTDQIHGADVSGSWRCGRVRAD
jgi:transcriptional regulator with XRE-family HTH domain